MPMTSLVSTMRSTPQLVFVHQWFLRTNLRTERATGRSLFFMHIPLGFGVVNRYFQLLWVFYSRFIAETPRIWPDLHNILGLFYHHPQDRWPFALSVYGTSVPCLKASNALPEDYV